MLSVTAPSCLLASSVFERAPPPLSVFSEGLVVFFLLAIFLLFRFYPLFLPLMMSELSVPEEKLLSSRLRAVGTRKGEKKQGAWMMFPYNISLVIPGKRETGAQPFCSSFTHEYLLGCWICWSPPRISLWSWEVFPFAATHTWVSSYFDTRILWWIVALRSLMQLHYMFCSSTGRWRSYSVFEKLRNKLIASCL